MNLDQYALQELTRMVEDRFSDTSVIYAFASGSVVEGLGHSHSDIDIFVVVAESRGVGSSEFAVPMLHKRVEITVVSESRLSEAIAKVVAFEVGAYNEADQYSLLLLHRLVTGTPLIGADAFQRTLSRLPCPLLSRYLVAWSLEYAEARLFEAFGAVLADELPTAVYLAERALNFAYDALLACYGSTSPVGKWRLKCGARYLGEASVSLTRYLQLASTCPLSGHALVQRQYIADVCRFIQAVCDEALHQADCGEALLGWETAKCRLWGPDQFSSKQALAKNAIARVTFQQGRYFLKHIKPICEVSRDFATVWRGIDNVADFDQVVAWAAKEGVGDARSAVSGVLTYLAQRGLVSSVGCSVTIP